ncbi:L,D-transpeptidase [Actinospica sp. MGRD01-02]|uniref:L,D-transpeptidase n=1 Tax=Actinospica acidithermotolerans TaxID=2828514 RepID=A0A941EBA1_9ACTN|nr:L,D-transpeptidase [Actinospica acidithermotolerans]MBR7827423.1 L,D-transpeptidase [Actinospica acidithermotolerans]
MSVSAFRRSIPLLAAGSAVAAVAVTAALTPRDPASASPAAATSIAAAHTVTDAKPLLGAELAASARKAVASEQAAAAAAKAKAAAAARAAYENSAAGKTAALRAAGVPCDIYAVACVSLSKQEAWLMRGGKVVYGPVRVATGRAGLPTPAGDFHVFYKVVNGWSNTYDAPMPYSVYFYRGDAFHEDPVTVRSHGCIHLSLHNAEYFYRFLGYGDLVEIRD